MSAADAVNARTFTQIINLDRSPDRLAGAATDFAAAGLRWTRLAAVDGGALDLKRDPRVVAGFDLDRWVRRHHRNPIATEIGCFLSHLGALRAFLDGPTPFGFILEDDARLEPHAAAALDQALDDHGAWDILRLHARHPGPLVPRRRYPAATLASFITKPSGATAYVVSRAAAERMLRHMARADRPYDYMYDDGRRMGLRVRILDPAP
ncbi:MAG: glycosyltransferase family 25 protein, partial [Parvularculaceae bacterium]|nr:glycosyltransferase family 25 protein [Parvularculaceae bacterium]